MPDTVSVSINGESIHVQAGCTVAAAVSIAGVGGVRRSVSGQPRGPLCGMGICFECRVTIDGRPHCRGCQVECLGGMEVSTE